MTNRVQWDEMLREAVALEGASRFDPPDYADPPVLMRKRAAVLILVSGGQEPVITLTLRQPHLREHAGQISFPGGGVEVGDQSLWHTARREAEEEIGLGSDHRLERLGALPDQKLISGYLVRPFIALSPESITYQPQKEEVARIIELPLSSVDTRKFVAQSYQYMGHERKYLVLQYGQDRIWGATARMLYNLGARISHVRQGDK